MAEEVVPFLPSMATYDDSGNLYGVEYSQLPIYLLKVVQEQQAEIDTLNKRLTQIENALGEDFRDQFKESLWTRFKHWLAGLF